MLSGRKYRLELGEHPLGFVESIGGATRYLWNLALEQRRYYRAKGAFVSYAEQCRQLTEVRAEYEWMRAVPVHCLQQALRDLDEACKRHGTWRVRWKSRAKTTPSFRYPDPKQLQVERLNRKWARVKLPKFGWVSFRISRPLVGVVKSATLTRDGDHWFIAFCVEDGVTTPKHAHPGTVTGVDRGVVTAAVTADGEFFDRRHAGQDGVSSKEPPTKEELDDAQDFLSPGELERLVRLQRRLARCTKGSARRQRVKEQIGDLYRRARYRRSDFNAQCAHRLTRDYALVGSEKLNTTAKTASAAGTIDQPGVKVAAKRGLNKSILNKGWYGLVRAGGCTAVEGALHRHKDHRCEPGGHVTNLLETGLRKGGCGFAREPSTIRMHCLRFHRARRRERRDQREVPNTCGGRAGRSRTWRPPGTRARSVKRQPPTNL